MYVCMSSVAGIFTIWVVCVCGGGCHLSLRSEFPYVDFSHGRQIIVGASPILAGELE